MLKNKIFASLFVLVALLDVHDGVANAQQQSESKTDAVAEKPAGNQEAGAEKASLLDRCKKPEYSRGVALYGLEGKTVVDFGTNSAGRVMMAEISRSSGWRILDEAVLMTIIGCKIYENPGTGKTYARASYIWHIEDSLETKPEVLADTCNKSELVSLAKDEEPGRGVVVGVRLNMDGTIEKTSLEWSLDPKLNEESIKLVNSCKFKPGRNNKRNRPSSISLRLLPLRSN